MLHLLQFILKIFYPTGAAQPLSGVSEVNLFLAAGGARLSRGTADGCRQGKKVVIFVTLNVLSLQEFINGGNGFDEYLLILLP
jgi:hypothetical protein